MAKENISAFGEQFTGGPHGLGDPNDRTLRRLEDQVIITQLVKDRAHHVACKDLIRGKIELGFIMVGLFSLSKKGLYKSSNSQLIKNKKF